METNLDINFYKNFYNDLSNLKDNELYSHYINYGINENRFANDSYFHKFFPEFDFNFYKNFYNDLKDKSDIEIKKHYINYGVNENRFTNDLDFHNFFPEFDFDIYKNFYNDIGDSGFELIKHYYYYGINEGRIICEKDFNNKYPEFDIYYYKNFNNELNNLNEYKLKSHYVHCGSILNKIYFEYDFIVDNYSTFCYGNNEEIKSKILDQYYYRNISNYNELYNYNQQFIKKYYIYNRESFYKYYNDFNYEYYKNRYFKDTNLSEYEIILYYHTQGKYQKHIINDKYKIIIYTPPFNINCGGIVVMHYLAQIINETPNSKFYAKLFMCNNLKYYNMFCNDFANIDEINDNTIVIYPETVIGNPLNCKNVVRWILLELGIEMPIDHNKTFGSNDLIYYWETSEDINKKQLCCQWKNNIFKNNKLNRDKTCYLIKKGRLIHKNINYIHPIDSINIENLTLKEINNIFNECKYFYCYDPNTAHIIHSAICGCISIVYPIENINKEEYFKSRMFCYNNIIYNKGIVYGNNIDEINVEINNINDCEEYYNNLFNSHENSVFSFLNNIENII